MLILGPLTGTISDRLDRKRLLLTTLFVNCVVSAAMTTLMLMDVVQVWHLAVGTAFVGRL
jgi:MFS family permease